MIDFATITAFRLVRRLILGKGTFATYLLVCASETQAAVEADLRTEVDIQLGMPLPISGVWDLIGGDETLVLDAAPIMLLRIDRWSPELVGLVDTHVVRLERTRAQFLFLATKGLAEQVLVKAPNFRSRLTDVFEIVPDDLSGGGQG